MSRTRLTIWTGFIHGSFYKSDLTLIDQKCLQSPQTTCTREAQRCSELLEICIAGMTRELDKIGKGNKAYEDKNSLRKSLPIPFLRVVSN